MEVVCVVGVGVEVVETIVKLLVWLVTSTSLRRSLRIAALIPRFDAISYIVS